MYQGYYSPMIGMGPMMGPFPVQDHPGSTATIPTPTGPSPGPGPGPFVGPPAPNPPYSAIDKLLASAKKNWPWLLLAGAIAAYMAVSKKKR